MRVPWEMGEDGPGIVCMGTFCRESWRGAWLIIKLSENSGTASCLKAPSDLDTARGEETFTKVFQQRAGLHHG